MSKVLGVSDFAKAADVEQATARVMLRSIGHPKKGRSYEFKSKDEIAKLIAKIRSGKDRVKKAAVPKKSKKAAPKKKKPAAKKPKTSETPSE